jgi:hypothetical protein
MTFLNLIKRKTLGFFPIGVLLAAFLASPTFADDAFTFIIKKQEEKEKYRWNLADWLNTRDKMRIQDLWLALHSPSPYEFYLGANYQTNQLIPGGSQAGWEAFIGGFSSIFGLEARYEANNLSSHWHGIFNFRFFGLQDQGTNMTLQLGLRSTDTSGQVYRNALAGLALTLYFSKFFGFEGLYRYYFASTPPISDSRYIGERIQGGAFIDFRFLRVFGDYIVDTETSQSLTGIQLGTKIYF